MSFFRTTPAIPFPNYLFPSLPFRRRKASTDSTSSSISTTSSSSSPPYLSNSSSYLRCTRCSADLCHTSHIISRGFTGRWGRAYLVSALDNHALPTSHDEPPLLDNSEYILPGSLPNTTIHRPVPRQLVTGAHTVSDISCTACDSILGWKYVAAEEDSQKYKVGKYILETKRVGVWTRWDDEHGSWEEYVSHGNAANGGNSNGAGIEIDDIEFDSQDEDECEDLFAGVWTPEIAVRRRARKEFGGHAGVGLRR